MSIDPVVPVHMAGQIFLDSSWQSTWAPVIAASITVVATGILVFGANWLTRKSIEKSNAKSLSEMKLQVEASNEVALRAIELNSRVEHVRLDVTCRREWIKDFRDSYARFSELVYKMTLAEKVDDSLIGEKDCSSLYEKMQNEVVWLASLFSVAGEGNRSFLEELERVRDDFCDCLDKIRKHEKYDAPNMDHLGKLFQVVLMKEYEKIRSKIDNPSNS